jgi:hypothetical protein
MSFGVGMAMGAAFDHPWGWGAWGTDWHGGSVTYNHNTYVSTSNTFANRTTQYSQYRSASDVNRASAYNRQDFNRTADQWSGADRYNKAGGYGAGSYSARAQSAAQSRGFSGEDRSAAGMHSGSFSGFGEGGFSHDDSFRGASSFGGDDRFGGFDRGGGGFGGGGFRGGGGRR